MKIREENAFEIPSPLNWRYVIVISSCRTSHCPCYIDYFFNFFHTYIKYICLQKENKPNLSYFCPAGQA